MKNLIATLIVAVAATSAFAAEPAKVEAVKKPDAVAAPATPKEMPKVEKPAKKGEKKAEAKADATKSTSPAKAEDKKAEAPKK